MKEVTSYIWIAAWSAVWLTGLRFDCAPYLTSRGIHMINGEYYRLFTGLLVHVNLFHLLVNAAAMYYTGSFLHGQAAEWKLAAFSLIAALIAQLIFSALYPNAVSSCGGSPVVFALIGLVFVFQIFRTDVPRLTLGSRHGDWIIIYAILANIPLFSGNISTLVIHLAAFLPGFAMGWGMLAAGLWS